MATEEHGIPMSRVEEIPFTDEEQLLREICLRYDGVTPKQKSVQITFHGKQFKVTVQEVT